MDVDRPDWLSIVHPLKRLRWRWITSPKVDFWPCWIALLFSVGSASAVMALLWSRVSSETWMKVAGVLWLWSLASFVIRWLTAPRYRSTYKYLIAAIGMNRTIAIVSVAIALGEFKAIVALLFVYSFFWSICDMFESAYVRCVERQLPTGVAEYEELEGPSLGL